MNCVWCGADKRLFKVDGEMLCRICAAEYYDMTDEELYELEDSFNYNEYFGEGEE
jgi:hypothetical protein